MENEPYRNPYWGGLFLGRTSFSSVSKSKGPRIAANHLVFWFYSKQCVIPWRINFCGFFPVCYILPHLERHPNAVWSKALAIEISLISIEFYESRILQLCRGLLLRRIRVSQSSTQGACTFCQSIDILISVSYYCCINPSPTAAESTFWGFRFWPTV